jgi:PAS domain S-box-containing protein
MLLNILPSQTEKPHRTERRFASGVWHTLWLALLLSGLCLSDATQAASTLEAWRKEITTTRTLAENDAPRAYQQAQQLQASLPADATVTDRARILNLLTRIEVYLALTGQAEKHAQLALDLAMQSRDRVGQIEAQLNMALNAINQARIDASVAATSRSVELLDGVNRPDLLGEALLRMSMMYRRINNLDSSVTVVMQAMEIAKRTKDPLALTYAHQGQAISLNLSGRYAQAGDHYRQMRDYARAARSKILEAHAIEGLADVMESLGNFAEGERLAREAIAMFRTVGSPFSLSLGLYGYADLLSKQGRHAKAVSLLDEAITIYEKYPNPIGLWYALNARSVNLQALGRFTAARVDAEHAYGFAQKIGFPVYLSGSARRIAEIGAADGNHQQTYQLFVEATKLADKVTLDKANARMVELAERYANESKQREIDELTRRSEQQLAELHHRALQQRWLWTLLGSGACIFVGTAYFLLRLRRSNRMLEALHTQVQRSRKQLQATFDAIPDLLFVLGLDGRYYDVHTPHSDLLAAPPESLIGKTVSDVMSAESASICLSALREAHERGCSTGKQLELTLPHGKFWFELSVSRKEMADGEEPRFIVLSRNITERKQAEELLHFLEQEFRAMVEHSPDIIARYDTQCRRIYVNSAMQAQFGLPIEKILGGTPLEISALPDAQAYSQRIQSVLRTGQESRMEFRYRDVQGGDHWGDMRLVPEFGLDGTVSSVLAVTRDITERKQMEHHLEESQLLLRQLAARNEAAREDERKSLKRELHDELGQYLLALRLGISVLDIEFGTSNALLQEKTQRLIQVVDSTIKVVRNVVTSLRPAALDLGIVSALEWLAGDYADRTGIQCALHICEDDIDLDDASATAVFRIVQESLTNIAKHAQASKVEIKLERNQANYLLEVRDNGRGFDPAIRKEKSFGLVSIRERAMMLGGEVDISSAPGRSTVIRVHIPVRNVVTNALNKS